MTNRDPLSPERATELVHQIVRDGNVAFSDRALATLRSEGLTTADCHNVLRWGTSDPAESQRGVWCYRLHTAGASVSVTFRSDGEIAVVSARRKQR